ncbi:hypothetical protein PIB30_025381 [Stylosanthes scabra]|uniref:Uncharacterized protein n=1 Tax=Stylosanthes scabra TaxID=79078 RepID=A0ABU6Z6T8_9FABA|nr:hypothetical protein [Stylosanthes scabra]
MEAGLVAWNEYFGVPCETGPSDGDGAGPSVNTGDEEAPGSGSGDQYPLKEEDAKDGVDTGGEADNEATVTRASSSTQPRSINETEVDGPNGDGNHLIGNEMPRLTGAIQALERRVSQLEMDKWEFLLNMAELVQQMSALMNPEERTE